MEGRRVYVKHPSYSNTFIEKSDSLQHDGRSKEDGAPGPGSGRYPLGSGKRPYQHRDGTLNLLGRIRYRTSNKYHLMSDDEIRAAIERKNLEKSLDNIRKETSTSYRISNKLQSAAEDIVVDAAKKAGQKVLGKFVDDKLDKYLGKDKNNEIQTIVKEFAEKTSIEDLKKMNSDMDTVRDFIKKASGKTYEGKIDYSKIKHDPSKSEKPETPPKEPPKSDKPKDEPKKDDKPKDDEPKWTHKKVSGKDEEKPKVRVTKTAEEHLKELTDMMTETKVSSAKINAARAMKRNGRTVAEIAKSLGISESTVQKILDKGT